MPDKTDAQLEQALRTIEELIRREMLTVVVETPEGASLCAVVSANLNGNTIDLWVADKFGNEIKLN